MSRRHRMPLLIGQAPGPRTDPRVPLYPRPRTSTGGRLLELMGVAENDYLTRVQRVNLLHEFPGRWRRDDSWPRERARVAAQAMAPLLHGRVVILVGRNVARAFGQEDLEWHTWRPAHGAVLPVARFTVAAVPHPSGRNHWYNREENREEARRFWADFWERYC